MDLASAKMIGAALAVLPLFGVGLGLGMLFSSIINAIGRNPSVASTVKGAGLLYFALIEATGLFALLIALIVLLG
ncbi:MAG: F0F1 ATP synthase subunit C [Bdellovibrionales bacterium]|jgi:F-type H+-transporting ATPase subunit c|nr:F0F1 ATP synthase subunit C [Bdellovibrionales bacterium]